MPDTNYWEKLLVNIEKIKEDWDQGKNFSRKLKIFLLAHDSEPQKKKRMIDFIMPSNTYELDDINNHLEEILAQPKAIDFWGLKEFYEHKEFVVEEYIANNESEFSPLEKQSSFFGLLKIFNIDENILINLLLIKIWNTKGIDETFMFSPDLTDRQVKVIETEISNFIVSIKRKNKGKYDFKGMYSFKNNNIFWIEKQSSDKMLKAFSKNIRFKPSSDILFNIDTESNLIEIKCSNNSLLGNIADTLSRRLDIKLIYHGKEEDTNINLETFKTGLSILPDEDAPDHIGICEASFNKLKISNSAPLVIPKRSGRDIRKTLNELDESEIIDLTDIRSIDYLKIVFEDSDRKIDFEKNDDGTLTLKLDSKFLNRQRVEEINGYFEEQFGVSLNQEIKETDETKITEETYNLIFASDIIDRVSQTIKDKLHELEEKNLIEYNANKIYWCNGCKRTFSEVETCPNCHGRIIHKLSKVKIKRNPKNILSYIRDRLKENGFDVKNTLIQRTYRKQKKYFLQIIFEKELFHLYYNDGADISNIVEHFKCSNIPIIVINNSRKKLKDIDNDIFPQNTVTKILLINDDALKDYFIDILTKAREKIEDIIITSANNSATRLKKFLDGTAEEYNDTYLEDDVFNLLRYIFKTGEKWGKSASGLTVPEGLIGYGFLKKLGSNWRNYHRSFIWDCKFTNSSSYNFNRPAGLQARDYITRGNVSSSIKKYSRKLSEYISFTNEYNETQYGNFANTLKRMRNWSGDVVLFELNALLKLYRLIKRNFNELDKRRNQLYEGINNLLKQTETDKNYTKITESKITNLVNGLLEKDEDLPQLNYEEAFNWFVSDTI